MDNHPSPDARTSHLRTLSKICGAGLSAFPVSPRRRSVRVSRPSYRGLHCCQHPVTNFFSRFPLPANRLQEGRESYPGYNLCQHPDRLTSLPPPPQSTDSGEGAHLAPLQDDWEVLISLPECDYRARIQL